MLHFDKFSFIAILLCTLTSIWGTQLRADDSGVDIAPAGGLVFKNIQGISMEKEILIIGKDKVDVTFIFKNITNKDIETDIAFPIPPYSYLVKEYVYEGKLPFNDFSVWVNKRSVEYKTESKAILNGKDFTKLLTSMGLSITDFNGDISTLRKHLEWKDIEHLKSLELIEFVSKEEGYGPKWDISLAYYWHQVFPAKKVVEIRHTYTPFLYYGAIDSDEDEGDLPIFPGGCSKRELLSWTSANYGKEAYILASVVQYILITGNNWDGPIKEFILDIKPSQSEKVMICSDLIKPGSIVFPTSIMKRNYQPSQNLAVLFFKPTPSSNRQDN